MRPLMIPFLAGVLAVFSIDAGVQTVDDIVARHIQARGGYERIKAIQTLKTTRTIVTQFAELEVVIMRKRPQSMRVEQTAPGQPPVLRAVTPDAAWDFAGGKLTNRSPAAAAETRELDADFDGLLVDWKAKGHTVELAGRETLPVATRSSWRSRRRTAPRERSTSTPRPISNGGRSAR
jgi:hypothetical protein